MNYLKNPLILLGIIGFLVLTNVVSCVYIFFFDEKCPVCNENESVIYTEPEEEKEKTTIFVDIKGYVKNPGVYEMDSGTIVNDLINKAGGIKKGGTTENINLSKKLVDESMLIISSSKDLKNQTTCSTKATTNDYAITESENLVYEETKQIDSSADKTTGKISINTASKEELMTLSGVGEKTAEKIIEYRTNQKFVTIEDLKNVSGIGDSIFEKIKDYITI